MPLRFERMAALAKLIEGCLHGLISEDEFVEAKSDLKNAALSESQTQQPRPAMVDYRSSRDNRSLCYL